MKKILILSALLLSNIISAQYTPEINSNRPSASMGAYSVSKGIYQLEAGYMYQNDEFHVEKINTQNNFNLQFRFGEMLENLEFIADLHLINYNLKDYNYNETKTGYKNLNFGAKFLVYDHYKYYVEKRNVYSWKANQRFKWGRLIPAVAIYTGVQFNSNHNFYYPELPEVGLKTMIIAQQHLSKRFSITYNFIGEHITDKAFENYNYIVTASLGLSNRLSFFGEHQGIISRKYVFQTVPLKQEASIRGGFTYKIHSNLQIDAFAGTSLDNQPHKIQAGFGFSWRNHKKYEFKDPFEL